MLNVPSYAEELSVFLMAVAQGAGPGFRTGERLKEALATELRHTPDLHLSIHISIYITVVC